jgi:hypothetical protein
MFQKIEIISACIYYLILIRANFQKKKDYMWPTQKSENENLYFCKQIQSL